MDKYAEDCDGEGGGIVKLSFFLFRAIIALNEIFETRENVGRGGGVGGRVQFPPITP
jgi:hypothetical protein